MIPLQTLYPQPSQKSLIRRDVILIVGAIVGVTIYILTSATHGNFGFPLDDSWIHQVYAKNLAQYGEWAFVHGIPSAGSTSPLYTILLSIGYKLNAYYYIWAIALDTIALALAAIIAARIADRLFPAVRWAGWSVGIAMILEWHFLWAAAAGMESMIFIALSMALLALTFRELDAAPGVRSALARGALVGLIGALLTIARLEGIGLLGLCGLLTLIARPQRTWRECFAWAIGVIAIWAIGVAPIMALNYSISGSPIPNTSAAKHAEYINALAYPLSSRLIEEASPLTAGGQTLLLPGLIYVLIVWARQIRANRKTIVYWVLVLWPIMLIFAYSVWLPGNFQHGRYVMPALPSLIILGAPGTLLLLAAYRRKRTMSVILRAIALSAAVVFIVFAVIGASTFSDDVHLIQNQMVAASTWMTANLPANEPIATHDIGAIGYFSPRPILDIGGLISPEVIPIIQDGEARMKLIQKDNIHYMMATVCQVPTEIATVCQSPTAPADPRLCPVFVAEDAPPLIHMTVYYLAWDGHCPPIADKNKGGAAH